MRLSLGKCRCVTAPTAADTRAAAVVRFAPVTTSADSLLELEREVADLRARIAELERNRELLNAIANTAPSLLCVIAGDGRVRNRATNIAFERTLGYEPSETGGVVFWERYVPPEDADDVRDAIEAVVAGGPTREHDGRWLTRDGEIIQVAWSCTALPEIEGGRLFLISATDIRERARHAEELRRSRARIVAAGDEARKRLERDLHDGAQQRLIASLLSLQAIRAEAHDARVSEPIESAIAELEQTVDELRELARGIHPVALTRKGLGLAVTQLAGRAAVPVTVDAPTKRYDEPIEAAAYYVVSEALANVARHAEATHVAVSIRDEDGRLRVDVTDDGVGAADPALGTGLRGLADRVAALDGKLDVESPPGRGTRVRAEFPFAGSTPSRS